MAASGVGAENGPPHLSLLLRGSLMYTAIGYAAQSATTPLAPLSFQRRSPRADDVAIEILYCGVCHSDIHQARNEWGIAVYPLMPGHEIIGKVSAVGVVRNETTLEAQTYLEKLAPDMPSRLSLIIDPMLATGNSMIATINLLKKAGCKEIRAMVLVAAPEGIKAVNTAHPDVAIYTAAIDQGLDSNSYIVPGLGDAGDKIFGTKQKES